MEQSSGAKAQRKEYFYYPAYGHTYNRITPKGETVAEVYARRVLAGVVREGKIYVAESRCFMGDEFTDADQFNKKRGRQIALARAWQAAGCRLTDVDRDGKTVKEWTFVGNHKVKKDSAGAETSFVIDIPEGLKEIGKLFVEEIEKRYPKHVKTRKGEAASAS
jgi:hypothetical protein